MKTSVIKFKRTTKIFGIFSELSYNKNFKRDFSENLEVVVIDLKKKTLITIEDDNSNIIDCNAKNIDKNSILRVIKDVRSAIKNNDNFIIFDDKHPLNKKSA